MQYEIPLTPSSQTLTIAINTHTYYITINWIGNAYVVNLYDGLKNPILLGIALVTGMDLLKSYAYLALGFSLFIKTDVNKYLIPTYDTLGVSSHLIVEY